MLLKKIESLEEIVRQLTNRWHLLKSENADLNRYNRQLQEELKDVKDKLEKVLGERGSEEQGNVVGPEIKSSIDECIREMEEGLELLREYKNGI